MEVNQTTHTIKRRQHQYIKKLRVRISARIEQDLRLPQDSRRISYLSLALCRSACASTGPDPEPQRLIGTSENRFLLVCRCGAKVTTIHAEVILTNESTKLPFVTLSAFDWPPLTKPLCCTHAQGTAYHGPRGGIFIIGGRNASAQSRLNDTCDRCDSQHGHQAVHPCQSPCSPPADYRRLLHSFPLLRCLVPVLTSSERSTTRSLFWSG